MQHCSPVMRNPSPLLLLLFVLLYLCLYPVHFYGYWHFDIDINIGAGVKHWMLVMKQPVLLLVCSLPLLFLKRWKNSAWIFPRGKQLSLFCSVCVVTVTDLCFKVIFFCTRGQWHGKGFMACLWLLKASLASWRSLSHWVGCERKHAMSKIS